MTTDWLLSLSSWHVEQFGLVQHGLSINFLFDRRIPAVFAVNVAEGLWMIFIPMRKSVATDMVRSGKSRYTPSFTNFHKTTVWRMDFWETLVRDS